jgi:hypothetical protein
MRTKHFILSAITVALVMVACNKETNYGPGAGAVDPLRQLFDDNVAAATQSFTINASTGGSVSGTDGCMITFLPNAFLLPNGGQVTGSVEVALVEALTIGDMIWLNKQTVGNDGGTSRLLRSGGELRLTATSAGISLRVVPNSVWISMPDQTPDPTMGLFMGRTQTNGNMIWDPVDSSSVTIIEDSVFNSPFYVFTTDSLGWINCDYFFNYPSITSLVASVPNNQPTDSTMCWIAFPSENAVMNMYESNGTFISSQSVPVGMQAVVIGLYRDGTSYYSSFNTVTITSNMTVPMTFSPTTLAQFQLDIQGI